MQDKNSQKSSERSLAEVLEEFLQKETYAAEKAVAWIRGILCLIFSFRLLLLVPTHGFQALLDGHPGAWMMQFFLWFGVGVSFFSWYQLQKPEPFWSRKLSVSLDFIVTYGALLPWILWPLEGYRGFIWMPDFSLILLVMVASAIRLSRGAFVLACVLSGIGNILCLVLDLLRNTALVTYTVEEEILFTCVYVAAVLIAGLVLSRTKHLVFSGAENAQQFERARHRMGKVLSEAVSDELLKSGEIQLGGRRAKVAVLFSDLRGFTTYSEKLDPDYLITELNAYMECMVAVIHKEGGIIDKFIGDAIMAVFGVPKRGVNDAAAAIRAAAGMQEALVQHNMERQAEGQPALRQGVGVHYGEVVAGNMGSEKRLNYTVIGDAVNATSRLESSTKELQVEVLVSQEAIDAAKNGAPQDLPEFKEIGELSLRGKEEGLKVYTLA